MNNALAHDAKSEDAFGAAAVLEALADIRRLAEQSRLLALNVALESAGAGAAGSLNVEMDQLAAQAGGALAEAARVASTVEALLEQIQTGPAFTRHCD